MLKENRKEEHIRGKKETEKAVKMIYQRSLVVPLASLFLGNRICGIGTHIPKTKPAVPSSLNIQDGDVTWAWTTKHNRCNVCTFMASQVF